MFCALQVDVWTADGYPLSDANVELELGSTRVRVPHHNLQSYQLGELACRDGIVHVAAPRLKAVARPVVLRSGAPLTLDVRLEAALTTGQLRGLVRSFGGQTLQARIRIEPLGTELVADEAGRFVMDVPPGHYEVVIEAPGHDPQRRRVEVTADGVVIVNADLTRMRR